MLKSLTGLIAAGVVLWSGTPNAHGQKSTEMYIPLGRSPGLSAKVTVIGKIESVSPHDRTLKIAEPSKTWTAKITNKTKIWLDRSKLGLTNRAGTVADLRKDQVAEIKYEDGARRDKGPAEWIKIQIVESAAESRRKPD